MEEAVTELSRRNREKLRKTAAIAIGSGPMPLESKEN
jgi:hypothetical protein